MSRATWRRAGSSGPELLLEPAAIDLPSVGTAREIVRLFVTSLPLRSIMIEIKNRSASERWFG